jgi:hypothetical protein
LVIECTFCSTFFLKLIEATFDYRIYFLFDFFKADKDCCCLKNILSFRYFVKLIEAALGYRIYFLFDFFVKLIEAAVGYRMYLISIFL